MMRKRPAKWPPPHFAVTTGVMLLNRMVKLSKEWDKYLDESLNNLITADTISFADLMPKGIPHVPGVYLISKVNNDELLPYYVGRSLKLGYRLYTNHLMGNSSTARLKKYLVDTNECENYQEAKSILLNHCVIQYITVDDHRKRGALEGYFTGKLFPKHGISKE